MKKYFSLFLAAIMLCTFCLASCATEENSEESVQESVPVPVTKTLRVGTYNIKHCADVSDSDGKAGTDADETAVKVIADDILALDLDIVGLQEVDQNVPRSGEIDTMGLLSEYTGYKYYYYMEAVVWPGTTDVTAGSGILSKYPIKNVEKIMIPDPETKSGKQHYETRCIIKTTIDAGTDITVMVSHFGLNLEERMNAVQTLVPALEREKCIFMGDLNTTPEEPVLEGIRARMTDADDYLSGKLLSYPSDIPEIKIDYIFVSPDIKIKYADIPAKVVSDHRPYIAKIEI